KLREHQSAVHWALGEQGAMISADALVVGSAERPVGPLSLRVPAGALVLARGPLADRRLVAATLGGRLDPVSGRAQLGGHPLPSEASRVSRLVAMAEVGGFERTDNRVTLGELLAERLRSVVAGSSFNEQSQPQQLPQFERGIALSLVALAERTPVVMLDQIDPFASADDERAFVTAVCALA